MLKALRVFSLTKIDADGLQIEKRSAVVLASWMSAAGVLWGSIYVAFGEPVAAFFPYGYAALTGLNTLVYRVANRKRLFLSIQILLTLLLPFFLMVALGGFTHSSAVILWSLVAPVAALVLVGERTAMRWFAAYVLMIVIGGILEPFGRQSNHLPPVVITAFFVMNVTVVSALVFVLLRNFFVQKNTAVRGYIQQELALRRSEKLATLGKLSAGVAHELNNPAGAAKRSVGQLELALVDLSGAQWNLAALALSDAEKDEVASLRKHALDRATSPVHLDALALGDRENEIEAWLESSRTSASENSAATLAEMGYTVAELEELTGRFPAVARTPLLSWLSGTYATNALLGYIGRCADHIAEVVNALKSYSYMDQAPVQLLSVHEGIESTLVILRSRLRTSGITVRREFAPDLPRIEAYGSELNEVWSNILDNAIQALDAGGVITLRTRVRGDWIDVEIEDDGPGIPESIQSRIFDPFFTTRDPGRGTGLGLNISHGIVVEKHRGRLSVASKPGQTRFTVSLPIDSTPGVPRSPFAAEPDRTG